jgi:hypothetical protein
VESVATPLTVSGKSHKWWTAEEIRAGVELDCERRGVRFYSNLFEKTEALYAAHRKRIAVGRDGTTSTRQLARDLYPDVGDDFKAARNKRQGIKERLELLVRMGAIDKSELRDAAGKALGLRLDLQAVPDQVSRRACSRGCSSVG